MLIFGVHSVKLYTNKYNSAFCFTFYNVATRTFKITHGACTVFLLDSTDLEDAT